MKDTRIEYKWLVGIVYVMAVFMDLLDMTVKRRNTDAGTRFRREYDDD